MEATANTGQRQGVAFLFGWKMSSSSSQILNLPVGRQVSHLKWLAFAFFFHPELYYSSTLLKPVFILDLLFLQKAVY